jgi:PIN domain nuclease of toxin-antitoxin system
LTHVVDAHALVWFLSKHPRLGPNAARVLADPQSRLLVPAIALAEACWAVQPGRSSIPSAEALLSAVTQDPRIHIEPLDADIIARTFALSAIPEMHDRQIVASARRLQEHGDLGGVLTADCAITASGLVHVVW